VKFIVTSVTSLRKPSRVLQQLVIKAAVLQTLSNKTINHYMN
jgi:hypothetical protein